MKIKAKKVTLILLLFFLFLYLGTPLFQPVQGEGFLARAGTKEGIEARGEKKSEASDISGLLRRLGEKISGKAGYIFKSLTGLPGMLISPLNILWKLQTSQSASGMRILTRCRK